VGSWEKPLEEKFESPSAAKREADDDIYGTYLINRKELKI
jgi:hypothetical protein